jgi:glycosyltransferase involved in cell wall biosynthesis
VNRSSTSHDVSVVIPARNAAPFLTDCLRSVLAQTVRPREIIVVDDHSSDATADVARSFGGAVLLRENPGRGVASALNHGIGSAEGPLIAHFDADDLMRPDKLATQVALYRSPGASDLGFVGSDLLMFDEHGPDVKSFLDRRPRLRESHRADRDGVILLSSSEARSALCQEYCVDIKGIYPKHVWSAIGGFDESMICVNDMDFLWRVACRYRVALVDRVLVDGRRHETNLSKDGRVVGEECITLFRRMLAGDLPPADRRAVRRRIIGEHRDLAHIHRKADQYLASAIQYLQYALRVA